MKIEFVVAMAQNRVIGRDGGLPWHLPEDLRHFRTITMGHPVLMGRLTWLSIGRALPGRLNIVLSTSPDLALPEGVQQVRDLATALAVAEAAGTGRCMVIGGAGVYAATLAVADVIHLTEIDLEAEGDTFFPELSPGEWHELARVEGPPDSPSGLRFRYITLERRDSSR